MRTIWQDMLNLTLALTKRAQDQLHNFQPHHSVLALSGPGEFNDTFAFPKTNIATLSNWFNKGIKVLET